MSPDAPGNQREEDQGDLLDRALPEQPRSRAPAPRHVFGPGGVLQPPPGRGGVPAEGDDPDYACRADLWLLFSAVSILLVTGAFLAAAVYLGREDLQGLLFVAIFMFACFGFYYFPRARRRPVLDYAEMSAHQRAEIHEWLAEHDFDYARVQAQEYGALPRIAYAVVAVSLAVALVSIAFVRNPALAVGSLAFLLVAMIIAENTLSSCLRCGRHGVPGEKVTITIPRPRKRAELPPAAPGFVASSVPPAPERPGPRPGDRQRIFLCNGCKRFFLNAALEEEIEIGVQDDTDIEPGP